MNQSYKYKKITFDLANCKSIKSLTYLLTGAIFIHRRNVTQCRTPRQSTSDKNASSLYTASNVEIYHVK